MDKPNQNTTTDDKDYEDQCSICLEPFTNKALAKDCLHNFCYQCILSWVQQRPVCPLCLEPIKVIESKANDTYYVENKKEDDNTSDAEDSIGEEEEEETGSDSSFILPFLNEYLSDSQNDSTDYGDEEQSTSDDDWC